MHPMERWKGTQKSFFFFSSFDYFEKQTHVEWSIFFLRQDAAARISAVILLALVSLATVEGKRQCPTNYLQVPAINCRQHTAVLTDFGGVGDGVTSNTQAFRRAIEHLSPLAANGGAQLIVPPGKWLTGSFNLTSHFTLFVHKDATILASQVWPSNNIYGNAFVSFLYVYMEM